MTENNNPVEIEKLALPDGNLAAHLHEAFARYECENLQFGLDWLTNLTRNALGDQESAALYVASHSTRDFVALALKVDGRTGQAHALANFYSSTFTPIIQSNTAQTLLVALLRFLAEQERFTALTLSPLDPQGPFFAQAVALLNNAGWAGAHDYACFANWTLSLNETSYQTYLANRPSQLSNTINRKTRRFLQDARGRMELLQSEEKLESAIETFVSIYQQSWKNSEPFADFMPELIRLAARRRWLRLGLAYYDAIPIASQIWLVSGTTAYIYKLAHLDEYKQMSPGTVLSAFMLQHVIDTDRVSTVDFLSGDDHYKKNWMSHREERKGVAAYNPRTLRGRALQIGRALKQRFK